MDRCGCYIRVSTVNQKDNFSVDIQRKRVETFCKTNGFEAVFYDEQSSNLPLLQKTIVSIICKNNMVQKFYSQNCTCVFDSPCNLNILQPWFEFPGRNFTYFLPRNILKLKYS